MMKFQYFLVSVAILGVNFVSANTENNSGLNTFDVSVHVIDTNKGTPASDLPVSLYKLKNDDQWTLVSNGKTTANGRFQNFTSTTDEFTADIYKVHFEVEHYFHSDNRKTMYPVIDIIFEVDNPKEHYHIPILLNAFGYTTSRGS